MKWNQLIIRYGELSLKGRNRNLFVQQLRRNVKFRLKDLESVTIRAERDRMFIHSNDSEQLEEVIDRLQHIFGIQSYSPIATCEPDMDAICQRAIEVVRASEPEGKTFKVEVKRADKTFPHRTHDIQQIVGEQVLRNVDGLTVKMKEPDLLLHVDIRRHEAQLSSIRYEGAGGMPVGASGRSLLMLSGGIDSPVAGYLMMKRGVALEAIHFASPPYTSDFATEKVIDLAEQLSEYGPTVKVHVIPFTEIQKTIAESIPENLSMTTTRRLMLQIADRVREERELQAIVTGESLGQVASQTLESMTAINAVTSTPVLRPLVTYDKIEIIDLSKKIGTYDISIRPYEDCCTIFTPSNPKTKPKLEQVKRFERSVDFIEMIERAVANREIVVSTNRNKQYEFEDLL